MSSPRVASFDGLRAVAIGLVVIGHALENLVAPGQVPEWLAQVVGNASFGVRLFFVLSGYLITSLLLKEKERFGRISLSKFYVRRTLRIFPAFYVYLGVMSGLAFSGAINVSGSQFVAAATYTWNYAGTWVRDGTAEGWWFLGHLWTLALEEQFYLFWPFLFILLGGRWISRFPWLIAALLPLVRVATYFLVPEWRGYLGMMFHTAIDSILMGCGFALTRGWWAERLRLFTPKFFWACVILVPGVLSPLLRWKFGGAYAVALGFTVDALCVGAILVCLHEDSFPNWVRRVLEHSASQWIGRLSYSLYLWQQPFLTHFNETWSSQLPWCFVAILAAACASYYLIELPVLRLKKRFERASLKS